MDKVSDLAYDEVVSDFKVASRLREQLSRCASSFQLRQPPCSVASMAMSAIKCAL